MTHVTPAATPASANIGLPFITGSTSSPSVVQTNPKKREPPLTPAASVDGSENISSEQSLGETQRSDPPKKKRRVALTRVGDLES